MDRALRLARVAEDGRRQPVARVQPLVGQPPERCQPLQFALSQGGRTRVSITSIFPDAAMEQLIAVGMEEGLMQAVGQIDDILAQGVATRRPADELAVTVQLSWPHCQALRRARR